jgi:aspartate aminotransferase-like enzyme
MRKSRLLTPGPVAVPERVLLAMAQPLVHHRTPEFAAIFGEVREGLRRVFQTTRDVLVLSASGTGAMEAAVANLVARGDRVLVVRGGKFGERFAELCSAWGADTVCIDVPAGEAVSPAAVDAALARHPDARALFVQACETSTGVWHPVRELAERVRERGPLLVVDGITGVGVQDLPMDAWGIDVLISASQKALLVPPGLAFVALGERAEAALGRASGPRYYFDLRRELREQRRGGTGFTASISLLFGLRESLRMLQEEGLPRVFARHAALAATARAAARALELELFARVPASATTAVRVPAGIDGKLLVRRLREEHGVALAGGQGDLEGRIFRIGHMGATDGLDLLAAFAALEVVLGELGWPVKLGQGTRVVSERLRELSAAGG